MREDGGLLTHRPVEDFDGLLHCHTLGHNDDSARLNHGEVKRGELLGAEFHLPLHEVLLQNIRMCGKGIGKADASDTLRQALGVGCCQAIVNEDKSGRSLRKADRTRQRSLDIFQRGFHGGVQVVEIDAFGTGVAPVFVFDAWERKGLKIRPSRVGASLEPRWSG